MPFNLLEHPLIRTRLADRTTVLTLPAVFAASLRREVLGFPALRPHQRHAWHAFLVQIGTLALLGVGQNTLPDDEASWVSLLRGLTPGHDDDAPWSLVAPLDRPALLQPPAPDGTAGWKPRETPDAADMLITARNHDVKQAAMVHARPDDWLFALVTLQTMEGYGGSTQYGISRMNGGSSSRPCVGVVPSGGPGAHLRRDILALLAMGGVPTRAQDYAERDGLALTWLAEWDGKTSLMRRHLHPLYIEVCRRIRLIGNEDGVHALTTGSKTERIAEVPGGITGDPWAPLVADPAGPKVLTMSVESFGYRRVVAMLLAEAQDRSDLQQLREDDDPTGLSLLIRGLVRGNSKTNGYHERRVPLSRVVRRGARPTLTDDHAAAAKTRVEVVGEVASALRAAVLVLLANGPETLPRPTEATKVKIAPFVRMLEARVDRAFFADLWAELEQTDPERRYRERAIWVRWMLDQAADVLAEAERSTPRSSALRLRARVRAEAMLGGMARRRAGKLAPYFETSENADAA